MMTSKFFKTTGTFDISELCALTGAIDSRDTPAQDDAVSAEGDEIESATGKTATSSASTSPSTVAPMVAGRITGAASLESATYHDVTCFHNSKYMDHLKSTKARAVFIEEKFSKNVPDTCVPLIVNQPYRAFAKVLSALYAPQTCAVDARDLAHIDPSAHIGKNVVIGAYTVIGPGAMIGDDSIIGSHVSIGPHVEIGNNAHILDHVCISHAIIDAGVYIKPGARIGQSGFGFHMDAHGHFDVPQLGCVRIGRDVQIGSNAAIDRGSQSDTIIGNGVRIDNLVQIAHNVHIGDQCVIVAQSGIAGSTTLGNFVITAGQSGISGHLKIGNHVKIAAQSGVIRDVPDNTTVGGYPAMNARDWHKTTLFLSKAIKGKQ